MVATTSGTNTFTMDVDDILDEALQPLGGEYTSGLDARKARRTLNLLLIELQNKEIPLHKIATEDLTLTAEDASYVLPAAIMDVLKVNIKTLDTDNESPLERYSLKQFHDIPTKLQESRPSIFTTERLKDAVTLKFWPTPDEAYETVLLVTKKIEDVTAAYQKVDVPSRYYPLLVKCLSYALSAHRQGLDPLITARLKADRDEVLKDTFEEDKERVDFTIIPGGISGF